VLLLAKLNLLCLEMLVVTLFFWSSTNSELNFLQNQKPPFENPRSATAFQHQTIVGDCSVEYVVPPAVLDPAPYPEWAHW